MGLFGFKKNNSFLGIDIGSTSIKLVELVQNKNIPSLLTYGYAERAIGDIIRGDAKEIIDKVANLLKKLYTEAGTTSYQAVTALPNYSVFNSVITLPMMNKKDLDSAVRWEAKKFVPLPLEEVVLDWRIIDIINVDKKRKNYRILLTAAEKNLVKRYIEIFKRADLQLMSLETEAFAMSRSLIGKSQATTMIIDTSAVTTDIVIIEKGIPSLNRSIDVGGITISRAVANSLNVDFKRAEQFKRDIGMAGSSKIPEIIRGIMEPVLDEMRYSIRLYQDQSGKEIEQVILSGGSAYLPGLVDYLSQEINIRVIIGDPWSRVSFDPDLKPALEEVAPRFSVAIGLALREMG